MGTEKLTDSEWKNQILHGDCLEVLKRLPDASIDSCVTDPPYGLSDREPTGDDIIAYLQGSMSLGPLKKGRQHCANSILGTAVVPKSDNLKTKPPENAVSFKVVVHPISAMLSDGIQLDNKVQSREKEVHNISSIRQFDDMLVDEVDSLFLKNLDNGKFCLRERQSFSGCVETCGCFTSIGPTLFRMVVRLVDDSPGQAQRSSSVVALGTTEVYAVLTLDLARITGELRLANSADEIDNHLLLSPSQDVGASSGTSNLFAFLQQLLRGQVGLGADRALSINVSLPSTLIDRFHHPRASHKDFMGYEWEIPPVAVWKEVYRVLKPGGYVLAFAGTRTFDIMSIGIRAAGFENRDTVASQFGPSVLQWVYGSGMPKSHNVSKALDKLMEVEREVVGNTRGKEGQNGNKFMRRDGNDSEDTKGCGAYVVGAKQVDIDIPVTAPATDEVKKWQGYGTALKPAWEPIVMFRKPLEQATVAKQVLATGTGAINVDASRVKHASKADLEKHAKGVQAIKERGGSMENSWKNSSDLSGANDVTDAGRWPANVLMVHSDGCVKGESWQCVGCCPVLALDTQSGDRPSTLTGRADPCESHQHPATARPEAFFGNIKGGIGNVYADSGGASRFFQQFEGQPEIEVPFYYSAKSSKKDKTAGGKVENLHPTPKPTALMAYLIKMVTPEGGLVLDPYCGSGTTCVAATQQGFQFVGIERDEQWVPTALARIEHSTLPESPTSEDGELDFASVAAMMSDD